MCDFNKNLIVLPDFQRDPKTEFPSCRVVEFLIAELKRLSDSFGDEKLFVSLIFLLHQLTDNFLSITR